MYSFELIIIFTFLFFIPMLFLIPGNAVIGDKAYSLCPYSGIARETPSMVIIVE